MTKVESGLAGFTVKTREELTSVVAKVQHCYHVRRCLTAVRMCIDCTAGAHVVQVLCQLRCRIIIVRKLHHSCIAAMYGAD